MTANIRPRDQRPSIVSDGEKRREIPGFSPASFPKGIRRILINSINLGEVFYILARERGLRAADYFLGVILPGLPIAVAENSFGEVMEAARLKATYPLSFADCFAAATAIRERAALVTGDPEFKKLGKAVTIDWVG